MSTRLRRIGDLVVGLLAFALLAAPGAGAAVPSGYTPSAPIENPSPASSTDHFGANMANAGDVNGDGVDDLMVGVPDSPDPGGLPGITGKVVFIDGKTGAMIGKEVRPPTADTLISHTGAPTAFGSQVATIGDLNGDGVPEHVVSAPGSDISSSAVDMGIVYVLDGKSNAVLRRIELSPDDRPPSPPGFGKALTSAIGEPACQGFGGTAPCPDAPSSLVARGDLDGRGKSEIIIGAPDYEETAAAGINLHGCPEGGPPTCPGLGRVYIYSGEDLMAAPANTPFVTPTLTVLYPDGATAAQQPHLGAALSPIGDVGTCAYDETKVVPTSSSCLTATSQIGPSGVPDGYPDFLASAPGLSAAGVTRAGQTFVVDGRHALLIGALSSPDPQQDAGFGPPANHQTAPGNLGASANSDIYLSATSQDAGTGRGYAFTGDVTAPNLLARLNDPAPGAGNGFGVFASLGDIAGDDGLSEFALGRLKGGPVQIMSSCHMTALETIPDADPGNGFGASIVPMGDLNGDGYVDLAVGAPAHSGGAGGVYLLKSNGSPGPDLSCNPPPPPPPPPGGGGGGGGSAGGGSSGPTNRPSPPSNRRTGRKVRALAKRSISFNADKKTVKIPGGLKLTGRIKASKRKASCEGKQKVAIQRLGTNNFWQTIDVAVSGRDGRFGVKMFPGASLFFFRANIKQTRTCMGATSNRVKVNVIN